MQSNFENLENVTNSELNDCDSFFLYNSENLGKKATLPKKIQFPA